MKPGLKIPPILLEGDEASPPVASGPGQKFALGERPHTTAAQPEHLPAGYGTGRLLLVARDPHGVYAHWDPDPAQQGWWAANPSTALAVRVYAEANPAQPAREMVLPAGLRYAFIGVPDAGQTYFGEVGFYEATGQWQVLAKSGSVTTPPDTVAPTGEPRFATLRIPAERNIASDAAARPERNPAPAPSEPAATPVLPPPPRTPKPAMPPHDAVPGAVPVLIPAITVPAFHPNGSSPALAAKQPGETTPPSQLAPASARHETNPALPAELAAPTALSSVALGGEYGVTSPGAGEQPANRGFWFTVNAELVVYGATEPGAEVRCQGQPVALRPDGTFSFRIALPDGMHELALVAESTAGEVRQARLVFVRSTEAPG